MDNGRVNELPFLEKLAALTNEKELEHLVLNECSVELDWNYPNAEIKNLAIEDKGKFRAEGTIKIDNKMLGGAIELGVARRLVDWLPNPDEIFPRQQARLFVDDSAFVRNDRRTGTGFESTHYGRDQGVAQRRARYFVPADRSVAEGRI